MTTPSKPPTTGCVETVRLRPETAKTQSSQQAGMVVVETRCWMLNRRSQVRVLPGAQDVKLHLSKMTGAVFCSLWVLSR